MKIKFVFLISLLLAANVLAQNYGQAPAPLQTRPIALVGATIHPVSTPAIANATIVFDQGKIVALGQNVSIPANAERIEVSGKHVYPAMIDANTTLGLIEIGSVRATVDFSETGPINPNVRAEVAVNPDGEMIPVTRANGVALALSVPQGGIISGTSALIMLDGWTWEQMTLKAPVGMHVNWPNMTLQRRWWITQSDEEQRKQMKENMEKLKEAFAQGRAYMTAKAGEAKTAGVFHESDSRWEAMIPVFERKIPVFVNAG
ncbi:amidohydrolase, partial [candidate division KSB1 bacterium]|nr:amidohydrolase [candidate division KSB1 bacterium]